MDYRSLLVVSLFLLILCCAPLAAQATGSPSSGTWENYRGTSSWSVTVTEDDTACGAVQPSTTTIPATLTHDLQTVSTSDLPHSPWTGTMSGNTLTVAARSNVPDPPGSDYISPVIIVFTPDCLSFSGAYTWDYTGSDGDCSGSTRFSATRTDGTSCPFLSAPAPPPPPAPPAVTPEQVADARTSLDGALNANDQVKQLSDVISQNALNHPTDPMDSGDFDYSQTQLAKARQDLQIQQAAAEQKYAALLQNDPNNYWLNMDMAELAREQSDWANYYKYSDAATSNSNIYQNTRNLVMGQVLVDSGFRAAPTPATSPVLSHIATDAWNNAAALNVPANDNQNQQAWYDKVAARVSDKVIGWFRTAISPTQGN